MVWNWELEPDATSSETFMSRTKSVPDIDVEFARNFVDMLTSSVAKFSKGELMMCLFNSSIGITTESPLTREKDTLIGVIEHLYLINVLSRTPENLPILLQFKAPIFAIQIAKLATTKLNGIAHDSQAFYIWWDFLRTVLGNCFQIVANFTNPRFVWQRPNSDVDSTMQSIHTDAKQLVISVGLMKVVKDILKFFSCNTVSDTASKFSFQILVLNTIGGLTYHNATFQAALREFEILESIVDYLGWKKALQEYFSFIVIPHYLVSHKRT